MRQAWLLALATAALVASSAQALEFGDSVQGRDMNVTRIGERHAVRSVLVVGPIHGDEPEGERIIGRLRRHHRGIGVDMWTVKEANPDGLAANRRTNAHGVDLNRNFPYRWAPGDPPGSGYYPGPHAKSEPETRALMKLIKRVEPRLTIWFHQPWNQVLAPCHGNAKPEKLYSKLSGIPLKRCHGQHLHGTATSWQEHRLGGVAFVVELPAGHLSGARVRANAHAVVRVATSRLR